MTRFRSVLAVPGALALAAAFVLGACSSDDTASSTTTTTARSASTASKFCDSWKQVEMTASQGPGGGDGPPDPAAMKQFASTMQPPVATASEQGPKELTSQLDAIKKIVDTAAGGGDASALDPSNPALGEPLSKVEGWAYDNCDWHQLPVAAVDYSFKDLPEKLPSGTTVIKFTNDAKDEQHMMSVVRLGKDSKFTVQEVLDELQTDPNAAEQKFQPPDVEFVGTAEAAPGQTGYAVVDLQPGKYVVGCFIPVGGQDGAALHTQKGMVGSFTVS